MTQEDLKYIEERLARAAEMMEDAKLLLDQDRRSSAVNRAYYGCFYSVCALLLTQDKYASKHSGVLALFQELWIKPGRLPVSLGKDYKNLLDRRHDADYGLRRFERVDVERWILEAENFVRSLKQEIADLTAPFSTTNALSAGKIPLEGGDQSAQLIGLASDEQVKPYE